LTIKYIVKINFLILYDFLSLIQLQEAHHLAWIFSKRFKKKDKTFFIQSCWQNR